jgi:hypothetical protein
MLKPQRPRKLLTSSVRVATLVVLGVAETACNIQVSQFERPDAAGDAGRDAGPDAAPNADAAIDAGEP